MKPLIAIPMGDPAGIGPEIVVKALLSKDVFDNARPVIIGDRKVLENAIEFTGSSLDINVMNSPNEGVFEEGVLNLIDLDNVNMDEFVIGKISGMCGQAAYDYIEKSIELAKLKKVAAVATTPINKESL